MSTRLWTSQGTLVVKNPPDSAGDLRDAGSIPGLERPPGGGHGNPLQYSCLSHGLRRLVSCSPQGHKELDMTEATEHTQAVDSVCHDVLFRTSSISMH